MKSIPVLFSEEGTTYWIAGFTAIHVLTAFLFMTKLGWVARAGILGGLILLIYANILVLKHRKDPAAPDVTLRVLPYFHVAMVLYATGIGVGALTG